MMLTPMAELADRPGGVGRALAELGHGRLQPHFPVVVHTATCERAKRPESDC